MQILHTQIMKHTTYCDCSSDTVTFTGESCLSRETTDLFCFDSGQGSGFQSKFFKYDMIGVDYRHTVNLCKILVEPYSYIFIRMF